MTKIFATGVTGYLGGDAIYAILNKHPEYKITCLVRDEAKGASLRKLHPDIGIVLGDLDDASLLEEEASKADIVCNFANATHEAAAQALGKGLARRTAPGVGFLIHTMGSGPMIFDDVLKNRYGERSDKIFNDLDGLQVVLAAPDFARARGAEEAVRAAGLVDPQRVKTAIVSTASAYGVGRGLVPYRMTAIHELVRYTLQQGHAVQVGQGKAAWRHVHVQDLSDIYLRLVEHAAAGGIESEGEPRVWGGQEGFYFAENGEHVWSNLAQSIVDESIAQGLVRPGSSVVSVEPDSAAQMMKFGQFFLGCNCRVEGRRARQVLSWKPTGPSLEDELPSIVAAEARQLELGSQPSA